MKRRWFGGLLVVGLIFGSAQLMPCLAQDSTMDSDVAAQVGISFPEAMDIAVKAVYGVLGALSIGTLALILYFCVVLRKRQVVPEPFRSELMEKIRAGELDDARRLCGFRRGPLTAVMLTALDHMKSIPDADPMLLRDVVEAEGARQSESIQGQTQYLMDIAVVAPMIGLLGTVFGMMIAFNAVSDQIAVVRPTALVAGVNKAMLTTAFGLVVGIPAMMFYAYFRRCSSKLVSLLESASADLFMALLSRRTAK
ncbi:MAG: MotA/TolQ/ExbB proton channel family protein [Verrucomicrobia bacterium]|jgi:biopolymer transport protein ExbB|nr:MotA/TolQ/ExbB proton channel family protein [Verrucomicrobiota bacterium]